MSASKIIFDSADILKVISVDSHTNQLDIYVQGKQKTGRCPNCLYSSSKLHSYYNRKFDDLPAFGRSTRIFLRSRKFYCLNDSCPLKVFTERFDCHFKPYKRITERLEKKLLSIALEAGGKPAERICGQFSISVSDTTLLRMINKVSLPCYSTITAIGVDDWAFKKREKYGSILVDLHTGKIIDLLPDREEDSLRDWLLVRPEVKIVTRDRYGKYHRAITSGAPQAQQVTDRWHLLKNLGEAIHKIMIREYAKLNKLLSNNSVDQPVEPLTQKPKVVRTSESNGVRKQRFAELKILQAEGHSIKGIATRLGMHRQTVKKYMEMQALARRSHGERKMLEQYFPYINRRIEEAPALYLKTLWNELKQLGYQGAYTTLSEALIYYDPNR